MQNKIFQRKFTDSSITRIVNEKHQKHIGIWLGVCSFMTAGAILIGGYTRLKNAGLSIVSWKPLSGIYLPRGDKEWTPLYEEYKEFPEYKLSSNNITFEKFKEIFFLEYFHRMWARVTGLVFLLPSAYFWYKNRLGPLKGRVVIYNILVLLQGLLGWYMVKSGLKEETMSSHGEPGVSQYRLTSHLLLALTLYSLTTWKSIELLLGQATVIPSTTVNIPKAMFISSHICLTAIFLTCFYGGIVAGLDAGTIYNTYPKMEGNWIPPDITDIEPMWKNFLDNPVMAQFIHRILGHLTVLLSILAASNVLINQHGCIRLLRSANLLIASSVYQLLIGVQTLVNGAQPKDASSHQFGALLMLTAALWMAYELTMLKKGKFIKKL